MRPADLSRGFGAGEVPKDLDCRHRGGPAGVEREVSGDFHEFVDSLRELGLFWAVISQPPPGSVPKTGEKR